MSNIMQFPAPSPARCSRENDRTSPSAVIPGPGSGKPVGRKSGLPIRPNTHQPTSAVDRPLWSDHSPNGAIGTCFDDSAPVGQKPARNSR